MGHHWPFQNPPRTPLDFVTISPGSEELLGTPASWNGVKSRLRTYSLPEVLDLIGRISILATNSEGDIAAQVQILSGLFGERSIVHKRVLEFAEEIRRHDGEQMIVLFHDAQLATAIKAAFLALPKGYSPPTHERSDHRRLGQALLMINSLIAEGPTSLGQPSAPAQAEALELFFLANGSFNAGSAGLHDFVRAAELYLRDRAHLNDRASYRNFADQIRHLTGSSPTELWAVFFAVYAHFASIKPEDMPIRGARLHPLLFDGLRGVSEEQAETFLQLLTQEEDALRASIEARYNWDEMKPWDVVPLARRPVVKLDGEYYLLSLRFLKEKLTTGLHHLFLDPETGLPDKERNSFLTYMGYVWEDYVKEVLERAYRGYPNARIVGEDTIKQRIRGKAADSVLLVDDVAVVFECKATLFTIAARAGEDWAAYLAKIEDLVFDAAEQLDTTIRAILDGRLADDGIVPSKIKRFVPVLLTLEPAMMNPFLVDRVATRLHAEGWLQSPTISPLQILDASELELFEIGASQGIPMHMLLGQKIADPHLAKVSFRNYLVSIHHPVLDQHSRYLSERFDDLKRQSISYLRGQGADDSGV